MSENEEIFINKLSSIETLLANAVESIKTNSKRISLLEKIVFMFVGGLNTLAFIVGAKLLTGGF